MRKRSLWSLCGGLLLFVALAAALWATAPLQAVSPVEPAAHRPALQQGEPADADVGPDHGGPGDDVIYLYGRIEVMPTEGLTGTWIISGTTFTADDDTEFYTEAGDFEVGACVKVLAEKDTPAIAEKIGTMPDYKCDPPDDGHDDDIRIYGRIEVMPTEGLTGTWTVSGTAFTADEETEFATENGDFEVGACVKVEADDETPTMASLIATMPDYKCGKHDDDDDDELKLYGRIEVMPTEGLTGTWVVSGTTFTADENTEFETEYGDFDVGDCVKVESLASAPEIATEIETQPAFKCDGGHHDGNGHHWFDAMLYGKINALPDTDDLTGTWVVGSVPFSVTAETILKDPVVPFAVGVWVKVRLVERDGHRVAVEIRSKFRGDHGGHDDDGNGCHDGREGHAVGAIVSAPGELLGTWNIGGIEYEVNEKTRLDENADYSPGVIVKVKYYVNDDDRRVATRIVVRGANGDGTFTYFGYVTEKPLAFVGLWKINGESFTTTDATVFEEEHGLLIVTAFVRATYRIENDQRVVLKLESETPPGGGDHDHFGRIERMGGNAAAALTAATAVAVTDSEKWLIGGEEFVVTPATSLDDFETALAVGSDALVNSYTAADGSEVATRIRSINVVSRVMVPILEQ